MRIPLWHLIFIYLLNSFWTPEIAAGNDNELREAEALRLHNEYRKKHGNVQPLELDPKLTEAAQKCAEYYLNIGKIDHNCQIPEGTGDNLFAQNISNADPLELSRSAVNSWYNEVEIYDFDSVQKQKAAKSGHFTQLVWKDSKKFGFALAIKPDYAVAIGVYQPAGNMYYDASFRRNVLPPDST